MLRERHLRQTLSELRHLRQRVGQRRVAGVQGSSHEHDGGAEGLRVRARVCGGFSLALQLLQRQGEHLVCVRGAVLCRGELSGVRALGSVQSRLLGLGV